MACEERIELNVFKASRLRFENVFSSLNFMFFVFIVRATEKVVLCVQMFFRMAKSGGVSSSEIYEGLQRSGIMPICIVPKTSSTLYV